MAYGEIFRDLNQKNYQAWWSNICDHEWWCTIWPPWSSIKKNIFSFLSSSMDLSKWTPKAWFSYCMTMEKAITIIWVLIFPYYCQWQDLPNKSDFLCANQNINVNADLPLKYQDQIVGWGVQTMTYLHKTLPKEANDVLTQCGTVGYAAL